MSDIIPNSFFEQRLLPLGVTDKTNKVTVRNKDYEHPMPEWQEVDIFTEDKDGNIEITYTRLNGDLITWTHMGDGGMSHANGKTKTYYTKRLKEPKGDMKYWMPKGQGTFPWWSTLMMQQYADKEKVETIYLTEGVFKAYAGGVQGIPVVGLGSITHYANSEGDLHEDIKRFIIDCRVENVVVLWDGDCTNISNKALATREDLTRRPRGFFNTIKAINKLVSKLEIPKEQPKPAVHFMHIKPDNFADKPKGLDDLLISAKAAGKIDAVVKDIGIKATGPFFYRYELAMGMPALLRYFNLTDAELFFNAHNQLIGNKDWFFKKDQYRWDDTNDKLQLMAPGWAKQAKWIGDEFFEEELAPGAIRQRRRLTKRDKSTMAALYGKNFLNYLEHYSGFCNVPDHFNYQRVFEVENRRFYNRYFPFPHVPEAGKCDTIINFVKHIFQDTKIPHGDTGVEYTGWEMGLDYIQLLLTKPTGFLPVVCLFSLENATGKSTFGDLMHYLVGDNAIQIGNADLQSDFNETYSDKLLAICEETLLERKKDAERIKALSTSSQISVNPKGQRQYSIDFFCKFMFFSNNRRMIYLTKHDERYWVIEVKKAKTKDIDLFDKMKAEVPAFLDFLRNRELHTKAEGRMHFHPSLIRTSAFYNAVKVNEPQAATDLRDEIAEMFYDDASLKRIEMPMKEIKLQFFSEKTSTKWVGEILRDYLNIDLKRQEDGTTKSERGHYFRSTWVELDEDFVQEKVSWKGRPYVFLREDFVEEGVQAFSEESEEQQPDTSPAETDAGELPF